MKKILYLIVLIPFMFINDVNANTIDSIKMDIFIDKNGNAHVTETWNAYLDQGTEGYRSYGNLGNSRIHNFKVSENGRIYTTLSYWNLNASFNDKAYKAGINDKGNTIELCWGISSYGSHKYELSYEISGFVAETDDSQIIYWELLPRDLDTNNVYIKIHADQYFSDELPVWGYGNYGGYAYVYDGYIEMSNDSLDSDEYMTILVKFDKGTFNTNNIIGNDFDYYFNMAEEGAIHYKENNSHFLKIITFFISIFMFFLQVGIIFFVLGLSISKSGPRSGKDIIDFGTEGNKIPNDINMFRDLPCGKDIFRAYWLAHNYNLMKKQTDFLGAILLKWLKEKQIRIESKTVGALFKKDETTIIFENRVPNLGTELENELYNFMYEASKDGILESKEFEKWCKNNYSKILRWFDKVLDYENKLLLAEGKLTLQVKTTWKIFKTNVYAVDPSMKEEAIKMKGLKEFFSYFENMQDKEAIEVHLWEEYLMYAQIFGLADKVAKQFKKLYPEMINDYEFESVVFINSISHSGMTSASTAKSRAESYSSGGGGFSSSGGGGGSFGGGGGGGFR